MRKRTLGVVLLAGLAMSGAGAFTGSNTFSNGSGTKTAGYGTVTATGVTVTDVDYNLSTTDSSKLASAVFTTTTDMTGKTAKMTLRDSNDAVVVATDCTSAAESLAGVLTGNYLITCDNSDTALSSFTAVGLTVVTTNA